jgi:hypothetical protein
VGTESYVDVCISKQFCDLVYEWDRISERGPDLTLCVVSWCCAYSLWTILLRVSVAYRSGGVQPPHPKFRSFAKDEPNSQFRGIYIRNNLITIWVSFI